MKRMETCSFFYRLLYAGTFSMVMLICLSGTLGISGINWKHVAVLMLSDAFFCAVGLLRGRQWIYASVLGLSVSAFLFWSIGSDTWLAFLRRVLDLPLADYNVLAQEQIYIELGRVFLLTLVCYLIQLILDRHVLLKIVSADIIGGFMLYVHKVPGSGVVFFVLYTSLILVEWIRHHWKKMKNDNIQAYVLGIVPFLAVYAVLLSIMPMQDEPYDWQWAKDIYRSAEEKITMYAENFGNIGSDYFDGTTSGFSGEGGFFSDILQDNRQLMTLGIGREKDMPVYLAGRVFDSFDGREWRSNEINRGIIRNGSGDDISDSERVLDVMETVYALEKYVGSDARRYYKNIRMDVSYRYFHTNYLLAPSKSWEIENRERRVRYHVEGNDFVFDRKAGYGTEYTLRFCQMNMDREELYRFLECYTDSDLEIWTDITLQYTGRRIPTEELYAYRDTIEEYYLPETNISPAVEEWLSFITADAESDVEKLKCIESALSSMAYSTSPGQLPETVVDEKSFLDYMLLDKREGYCAHYATAFVLLARAEGFPARYVQGFCVPLVRGGETPVYSDMAHAWPEVYISGKGWIPFEPTPGFGANRYTVWEKSADSDKWTSYTGKPQSKADEGTSAAEGGLTDESVQDGKRNNHLVPYLLRAVWILLVGSVLAFIIDWLLEKHRAKGRDLGEKYRLAVLHNLQILDMLGYKRELSETYHELTQRIRRANMDTVPDGQEISDNGQVGAEDRGEEQDAIPCGFIDIYEKYLYGSQDIDEQILDEVLAERAQLLAQLRKCRRKTYLLCRIRLYIVRYR